MASEPKSKTVMAMLQYRLCQTIQAHQLPLMRRSQPWHSGSATQAVGNNRTQLALLGNRLTVDQRTLTPLVLVRIQVPQPNLAFSPSHTPRHKFLRHFRVLALREAYYKLGAIADILDNQAPSGRLMAAMEEAMLSAPGNWQKYYSSSEDEQ